MTSRRRLVLQPLETLRVQEHGSFELVPVDLALSAAQRELKPGLEGMLRAFLGQKHVSGLPTLAEQQLHFFTYDVILSGGAVP